MRHHTKDKGDVGVLKSAAWFAENGYVVMSPMTEHAPFDLVAYRSGLFWRVQVKYRTECSGVIECPLRTSWADRHGTHTRRINRSEVDVICIYNPSHGLFFISPANEPNVNRVALRLDGYAPKNGQSKRVRSAEDCREMLDVWAANFGRGGEIRTPDTVVRSHVLYPTELHPHERFKLVRDLSEPTS
jgi:hypothetical protein